MDLSGIEKLLLSLHAGMAAAFHIPEINLEDSEAKGLADAMARVARHYPVLDKISEKSIDHANLFVQIGGIYGTRFMAIRMRMQAEAAKPTQTPQVVTPFRPVV